MTRKRMIHFAILAIALLTLCKGAYAQDSAKKKGSLEIEVGAVGALFFASQEYDLYTAWGVHEFGGGVYGAEFAFKWQVAKVVRLGFRKMLMYGYMSHEVDTDAWSSNPTTIVSQSFVSGFYAVLGVLELRPLHWFFLEGLLGFVVPVKSRTEPIAYIAGGGAIGVSLLNRCPVRPYLRLSYLGMTAGNITAKLPMGSLGIRF